MHSELIFLSDFNSSRFYDLLVKTYFPVSSHITIAIGNRNFEKHESTLALQHIAFPPGKNGIKSFSAIELQKFAARVMDLWAYKYGKGTPVETIICSHYTQAFVAAAFKKQDGVKVIYCPETLFWHTIAAGEPEQVYRHYRTFSTPDADIAPFISPEEQLMCELANEIICLNTADQQHLVRLYPVANGKTRLISFNKIPGVPVPAAATELYGFRNSDRLVFLDIPAEISPLYSCVLHNMEAALGALEEDVQLIFSSNANISTIAGMFGKHIGRIHFSPDIAADRRLGASAHVVLVYSPFSSADKAWYQQNEHQESRVLYLTVMDKTEDLSENPEVVRLFDEETGELLPNLLNRLENLLAITNL